MANDSAVVVIDAASRSRFHEPNRILGGPNRLLVSSLKRKRPPKIDIPIVLREIPADICNGQAAAGIGDGAACFSSSSVAVFAVKGKKKFMEDAHNIFHSSNATKNFFGVYDGHGGSKAAEFVAENLHLNIFEMLENSCGKEKEKPIREAYLRTDKEFLKQGLSSGVCCVTAMIQGKEMAVSNLGDCRAVLCRDGVAEAITTDHKPEREDERRRIEDKGGFLEIHRGTWRVHGTLAVSRSIGDAHLKDWVMAEPDTQLIHLTPDMQYLVLASDGLWDEVSNQEAVDIVMQSCSSSKKLKGFSPAKNGCLYHCTSVSPSSLSPRLPSHKSKRISHHRETQDEKCCELESLASSTPRVSSKTQFLNNENDVLGDKSSNTGLLGACKELVNLAVARGSLDDVTVMVVDLSSYNG
ncbi:protein-serine/threonine phosphatase [Salvia divinorum]|uniref:protein-serine/threonine phosphatase n=1 Tax=Salvia divinorum TaxID=28513 RepID=A0ABD1H337_SALDI